MSTTTEPSATAGGQHTFAFGPFRLLAAQRLLEGDKPVRLGSRASDILTALVERAGEVVDPATTRIDANGRGVYYGTRDSRAP